MFAKEGFQVKLSPSVSAPSPPNFENRNQGQIRIALNPMSFPFIEPDALADVLGKSFG